PDDDHSPEITCEAVQGSRPRQVYQQENASRTGCSGLASRASRQDSYELLQGMFIVGERPLGRDLSLTLCRLVGWTSSPRRRAVPIDFPPTHSRRSLGAVALSRRSPCQPTRDRSALRSARARLAGADSNPTFSQVRGADPCSQRFWYWPISRPRPC